MRVKKSHLKAIAKKLHSIPGGKKRRVRVKDDCVYIESGRKHNRIQYVRLAPKSESQWKMEELSTTKTAFVWKQKARGSLDSLIARWDAQETLYGDLRLSNPKGISARENPSTPDLDTPAPISRKERETIREQLKTELAGHRDWLVDEFKKLSAYSPPCRLRRLQLELDVGALHDGLSWSALAVDTEGDVSDTIAPKVKSRNLWSRSTGRRIGSYTGGWYEEAEACLKTWAIDCYREASPKLPCPIYLSIHEGLDRGINLATGRSVKFRSES